MPVIAACRLLYVEFDAHDATPGQRFLRDAHESTRVDSVSGSPRARPAPSRVRRARRAVRSCPRRLRRGTRTTTVETGLLALLYIPVMQ